jgi:uncharacterized iron-regulated protein
MAADRRGRSEIVARPADEAVVAIFGGLAGLSYGEPASA